MNEKLTAEKEGSLKRLGYKMMKRVIQHQTQKNLLSSIIITQYNIFALQQLCASLLCVCQIFFTKCVLRSNEKRPVRVMICQLFVVVIISSESYILLVISYIYCTVDEKGKTFFNN